MRLMRLSFPPAILLVWMFSGQAYGQDAELWDVSWNSPDGSWKGLLEVSEQESGEVQVVFDGLNGEGRIDNGEIELQLEIAKDGVGGEVSGQVRKIVQLAGTISGQQMAGTGHFEKSARTSGESFAWKAERINTSGDLGKADLTGTWQPMTVALSSWRPVPLPLTDANSKQIESFVWYRDEVHRCVSPGITRIFSWPYRVEFLQNDNQLTMIYETDSIVRRLLFNEMQPDSFPADNLGFSTAEWIAGDRALRVQTQHVAPHSMVNTGMMLIGDEASIDEKIVVSNDGNYLFWTMKVTEPASFTKPIIRKGLWKRISDRASGILPYECDPYAFFNDLNNQGLTERYFDEVSAEQ